MQVMEAIQGDDDNEQIGSKIAKELSEPED